jgi:epoxyqueuosine reductase
LLDKKWGDFRYGISIIKRLDDNIIDEIENGPTLEYYHYYNRINRELAEKARDIRMELFTGKD